MTMITAVLIPADDSILTSLVEFNKFDYAKQSELISAKYLDFIRINEQDNARIIIDDTGRLFNSPINKRCAGMYPGPIHGDVLLVGWNRNIDPMGEDIEVTDAPMFYQAMAGAI